MSSTRRNEPFQLWITVHRTQKQVNLKGWKGRRPVRQGQGTGSLEDARLWSRLGHTQCLPKAAPSVLRWSFFPEPDELK